MFCRAVQYNLVMSILRKFQTGDQSGFNLDRDNTSPEIFFDNAEALLRRLEPEVRSEVVPSLEQFDGNWHPLGFMSWKLGTVASVGTLRLHTWPAGLRRESPRGPKIHDHGWHLSSLIMEGTYTDTIFDVQEVGGVTSEEIRKRRDLLRVFRPVLKETSAALETDGTCAIATAVEDRSYGAGTTHRIPIKVFHITDIEPHKMATTLVLESPPINGHTRILMDTPMDPLRDPKHIVSLEDALFAKEQIMQGF